MNFFKTLGCYPPEYNRAVHGPFLLYRYYGPKDLHWSEVKISEIPGWIKRRKLTPRALTQSYSRSYALWKYKNSHAMRSNSAFIWQFLAVVIAFSYINGYKEYRNYS